jgi:hypothetical protein
MENLLRGTYGFTDVTVLRDHEATTAAMLKGMNNLVAGAAPGDVLVFHYSGHGAQIPSTTEPDGTTEIICPVDLDWIENMITDSQMKEIFDRVPSGCNLTVILDCCHSSDDLNQLNQYLPATNTKEITPVYVGNTVKEIKPPEGVVLSTRAIGATGTSAVDLTAVLIAGCMTKQTSADTIFNGIPQGAATRSILDAVVANPDITYRQLVDNMSSFMVTHKYTQRPELNGPDNLYDQKFLQSWTVSIPQADPPIIPAQPEKKKDNTPMYIVIAIAVLAVLFFLLH